jgi:hypothetical protein
MDGVKMAEGTEALLNAPLPWLALPKKPRAQRGGPRLLEARSTRLGRERRANYDWKAWPPDQLPLMERYWDEFVANYQRFFPARFRAKPATLRGINLGTFNGCFQKAWQRLGYRMYGVEHTDVIAELHEYGCEGQRGNFFSMPDIPDASFDFGVCDRAMCSPELYAMHLKPLDHQPSVTITDKGVTYTVPPFFAEMMRIIKPDGMLFAVFYRLWTERFLRELFSYGHTTMWLVEASGVPYLAVMVDRSLAPRELPTHDDFVAAIERRLDREPCRSADALAKLVGSMGCISRVEIRKGIVHYHFVPNNHVIGAVASDDARRIKIVSSEFWNDSPLKDWFFREPLHIEAQPPIKERRRLVALLDDRSREIITPLRRSLRYEFTLQKLRGSVRGTKQALANIEEITRVATGGTCVLSLTGYDAEPSRRGLPPLSLEQHVANVREIVAQLRAVNCEVVILGAIPFFSGAKSTSSDDRRRFDLLNLALHEYSAALGKGAMNRSDARFVDAGAVLGSRADYFTSNGEELSDAGATALADTLARSMHAPRQVVQA